MNYLDIYAKLMVKAKSENREKKNRYFKRQEGEVYYEAHHIIPKCKGGEGSKAEWKTHENIVLLTFKEHYIAHKLLVKIFPNDLDIAKAFWVVCNSIKKPHSSWKDGDWKPSTRTYETLNEIYDIPYCCEDCGTEDLDRFGKSRILCYKCEWERTKQDEEELEYHREKNRIASRNYHNKNKVLKGKPVGEQKTTAVFTEEQVKQMKMMKKYLGWGKTKITKTLGLPVERISAVGGILDGSTWKHIVI